MRSDEWRDLVCDRGRDRIPGRSSVTYRQITTMINRSTYLMERGNSGETLYALACFRVGGAQYR